MPLDPDDPKPPYRQVANDLRAAILTGRFAPGEKLASGPELARRYGVARMTVQQAIRLLRDEGLVVSRQGSGVYVRVRFERPAGLVPHLERAFAADQVSIDYSGPSCETLARTMAQPLDQIRAGRLAPSSVVVRMILHGPWGAAAIADAVRELGGQGLVPRVSAQVRRHGAPPMFRLYVLNQRDVFFGFGPVVPCPEDSMLFHHAGDYPDSPDGQYVAQARAWFDAVWTTIGRD
jgi:DNA-binding transcriptional regulator YhcF (GntR family)